MENKELTVVIVDENPSAVEIIKNILEHQLDIHQVHATQTSEQAWSLIKELKHVDWLLTELELADSSAFDFIQKARGAKSMINSQIVIMSERQDREALLTAAIAGVSDYFLKPFSANKLVAKMRKLLRGEHVRNSERVTVLNHQDVEIEHNHVYQATAKLLDISEGGCHLRATKLKSGGVFDLFDLKFGVETRFTLPAEMVRIERFTPNGSSNELSLAFQFSDLDESQLFELQAFIQRRLQQYS
ncbi:MAG: response regulator [Gammaproteobacteria bacterium]|nr:response regulator [Gammaproteobacteria bacterium]